MTIVPMLRYYAAAVVLFFAIDMLWLGVVARGFYRRHLGYILADDVRWGAAVLFYLIYLAALVVFVVVPAVERQSVRRALLYGAFFGLAAYAAFDLTSLALIRGFPMIVVVVDLVWGMVISATVAGGVVWLTRAGL